MRRRAPRPATVGLRAALERAAPRTPLAAAQAVWEETVGEQLARVAQPVSERDGELTVSCESAVWAQELDLMQARILDLLRDRLGDLAPRSLRFRSDGDETRQRSP
jgi:predicted nucleic acid-binding Zn ribbon protein